jgi:hypothetical protein
MPGWPTALVHATPAAVKAELYLRRLDAHTVDLSASPAERRAVRCCLPRLCVGAVITPRCLYE